MRGLESRTTLKSRYLTVIWETLNYSTNSALLLSSRYYNGDEKLARDSTDLLYYWTNVMGERGKKGVQKTRILPLWSMMAKKPARSRATSVGLSRARTPSP